MSLLSAQQAPAELGTRIREAVAVTGEFMSEIIGKSCRRFPSPGQRDKTTHIEHLIEAGAWTDAVLALLDLELPLWRVRRLAYDEGEWHCALSRQRELPDWLDQSVETHHADLAPAILAAFVEARRNGTPSYRTSVPTIAHRAEVLYEPLCSDNFC